MKPRFFSGFLNPGEPGVCTLDCPGFRHLHGFRDLRESQYTTLLFCGCLNCLGRFRRKQGSKTLRKPLETSEKICLLPCGSSGPVWGSESSSSTFVIRLLWLHELSWPDLSGYCHFEDGPPTIPYIMQIVAVDYFLVVAAAAAMILRHTGIKSRRLSE